MTGGLTVHSEPQTGGAGFPLHQFGVVADLTFSSAWGGGCLTAEWSLAVPVNFNHTTLTPGRLIRIYDGIYEVWRGVLTDPDRGVPWRMHAAGLASLTDRYANLGTAVLNTAVDAAITRGLPISRSQSLTSQTATIFGTIAEQLNAAMQTTGKRWGVFADGFLVQLAENTTPDYLVTAVDTPGGRTVDDYASHLYAIYTDSTTHAKTSLAYSGNPSSNGILGRYEQTVDLTDRGEISAANAQLAMGGMLTAVGPRAGFTGTINVQPGGLLSLGGIPVRLSTVRAGKLIRFMGCEPDPMMGELTFATSVDVTIGQVDYDATTDTLRIQPLGMTPRDLRSLLTVQARNDSISDTFGANL